jgi:uracil-DNA glycosylase family 4
VTSGSNLNQPPLDPEAPARASEAASLTEVEGLVCSCAACPRLTAWREQMARERRAAFRDQEYWGRGVPGFGDPAAWLVVVGLAPAAHGANRTGRMFTGDRSGDWLYGALHRAGLASQSESSARDDGLRLEGVWITAANRCAPPANRPTPSERDTCSPFLERELELLRQARVFVCLGQFGFDQLVRIFRKQGFAIPRPKPKFGHGREVALDDGRWILSSFHPSQQNTFTGRLTEPMFDRIWQRARELRK